MQIEGGRAMVSLSREFAVPAAAAAFQPARLGHDGQRAGSAVDILSASFLELLPPRLAPVLDAARSRAERIASVAQGDELAAAVFAGDLLVGLAAEGELDPDDPNVIAATVAKACSIPIETARMGLYLHAAASPTLLGLPPVAAAEIQLGLLVQLGVAAGVSLWLRGSTGEATCVLAIGTNPGDRQTRNAAKTCLAGRDRRFIRGHSPLCSSPVDRLGTPEAAIVIRPTGLAKPEPYLCEAATALAPVLERERLLDRGSRFFGASTADAEQKSTQLALDLHDGPVQDVLVLGAETTRLRDDAYPFVLESHRELVHGRFDDLIARIADIDRRLRATAHSLESMSILSRPLAEVLHREVETFSGQNGVHATMDVRGDPEALSTSQRLVIYRGVQEALTNVREHSGAASVAVRLHVRRSTIEVRVTDDGRGFEVERSLALAAERGRLGLVGIGERIAVLGGSFRIDSSPGGPTTLRFLLPRWESFQPPIGGRS